MFLPVKEISGHMILSHSGTTWNITSISEGLVYEFKTINRETGQAGRFHIHSDSRLEVLACSLSKQMAAKHSDCTCK